MEISTHAKWLSNCADRLVDAHEADAPDWKDYSNVAHQIAQARPSELREFVESYPLEKALAFAPLMVLAWRIVGMECGSDAAHRASDAIMMLCDLDEWEKATAAFGLDH